MMIKKLKKVKVNYTLKESHGRYIPISPDWSVIVSDEDPVEAIKKFRQGVLLSAFVMNSMNAHNTEDFIVPVFEK